MFELVNRLGEYLLGLYLHVQVTLFRFGIFWRFDDPNLLELLDPEVAANRDGLSPALIDFDDFDRSDEERKPV